MIGSKIACTLLASTIVLALGQGNRRTIPVLPKGPVSVTVTPIDQPVSLEEVTLKADIIIDGTVIRNLPSVSLSSQLPHSIETDSLIQITRLVGGNLPPSVRVVAVSQLGGVVGTAEAIVEDDPLLQVGERYIFFLQRDDARPIVTNSSGAPRYSVLGVWTGKAKVVDNKVKFSDKVSSQLRKRNGSDALAFLADVEKIRSAKEKQK